jgi:predicted nucleotidyltransferase
MAEVLLRFGSGTRQREAVSVRLQRIHELAGASGAVERLIIFGSYVTAKPEPNDIDLLLVLREDFQLDEADEAVRLLFDHARATEEYGASIFWLRPSMLVLETLEEFLAHWQIKRDRTRRGIVEVRL